MAEGNGALRIKNGTDTSETELKTTLHDASTPANSLEIDGSGNANTLVNNGSGGSAVNIQDGGNTITVDAAALPLPAGAATEATLATIDADTGTIAGDTTSLDAKIVTDTDDDSLTAGTSHPTSISLAYGYNGATWERLTTDGSGALDVNITAGAGGPEDTDDDSIAGAQTVGLSTGLNYAWDGSVWERLNSDASGRLHISDGGGSITVDGTVSLGGGGTAFTPDYQNGSSVAASGTDNHEKAAGVSGSEFDQVQAAAGGDMKVEIWVHTSSAATATVRSSGTQIAAFFNSAAQPNQTYTFKNPVSVASGSSLYVLKDNDEPTAQDLHSTIEGRDL